MDPDPTPAKQTILNEISYDDSLRALAEEDDADMCNVETICEVQGAMNSHKAPASSCSTRFQHHCDDHEDTSASMVVSERKPLDGVSVLVAEDDEPILHKLESMLISWGAVVNGVSDGMHALKKYEENQYDVVIMEGFLPMMTGWEVSAEIRKREQNSSRGLVATIVGITKSTRLQCLRYGMDDVVSAQVQPEELLAVLQRLLPLRRAAAAAATKSKQHFTVLVVEDEVVNMMVLQAMLVRMGHEVVGAENGQLAVEHCAARKFDLVLMDCNMPVMDGWKATLSIRQDALNRSTPIVAVTAQSGATDRQRCFEWGMNDVVPKPVNKKQLESAVQRWAGRS